MKSQLALLLRKSSVFRFVFFIGISVAVIAIIIGTKYFLSPKPVLESLSPALVSNGETVVLRGKAFGSQSVDSYLEINHTKIPAKNCLKWTDTEIAFVISEYTPIGLISVHTVQKHSNQLILTRAENIPTVRKQNQAIPRPVITALSKKSASIGSIIAIKGENFGDRQNKAQVLFTGSTTPQMPKADTPATEQLLPGSYCSNDNFDIQKWTDTEIRVRVPDAAQSGGVVVITDYGMSNPLSISVKNSVGKKIIQNPRNYSIEIDADISNVHATDADVLFLHAPIPLINANQPKREIVSITPEPFVKNYQHASVHQLRNFISKNHIAIKQEYTVTRFEIQTKINPQRVSTRSRTNKELYAEYTKETAHYPIREKAIQKAVRSILGNRKNPYYKARKIYRFIVDTIEPSLDTQKKPINPLETLDKKRGDSYDMVMLFCTLARAAHIPAVPVAGIAINTAGKPAPHCWAEFYLEGFGWVPIDPGMEHGLPFTKYQSEEQIELKYFGTIDPMRVAFSRDYVDTPPMIENAVTRENIRSYALRDIWEESSKDLPAYTALWRVPRIKSIY